MFKFRLVTDHNKPSGRQLKYKTLAGARKALNRILGTSLPKKDPDGYAVGDMGQCLFFLDGLTFEDVYTQKFYKPYEGHLVVEVKPFSITFHEGIEYSNVGGEPEYCWIRSSDLYATKAEAEKAPAATYKPFKAS